MGLDIFENGAGSCKLEMHIYGCTWVVLKGKLLYFLKPTINIAYILFSCADFMANLGSFMPLCAHWIDDSPRQILDLLQVDVFGVSMPHSCNSS